LPVPFGGRSLLDLPIGGFEVLHDCVGDLVLFILGERAAHAANVAKPFTQAHDYGQPQLVSTRPHADMEEQTKNDVNNLRRLRPRCATAWAATGPMADNHMATDKFGAQMASVHAVGNEGA
jgi:hypothetical protein